MKHMPIDGKQLFMCCRSVFGTHCKSTVAISPQYSHCVLQTSVVPYHTEDREVTDTPHNVVGFVLLVLASWHHTIDTYCACLLHTSIAVSRALCTHCKYMVSARRSREFSGILSTVGTHTPDRSTCSVDDVA